MPFNDQNNYYGSPYSDPAIRFRTYHEMLRKIYEHLELLKIIEANLTEIENFIELLEEVIAIKTDIEVLRGILDIDSITSNTVGLGLKTFTIQEDLNLKPGQFILAIDKDNPDTNYMWGVVTDYTVDQLTMRSDSFGGSGTLSNWAFTLTGEKGVDGAVNLVVGTDRNQYLNIGQFQDNSLKYFVTTGSTDAYILTPSPAITSYVEGQSFYIKANFDNTGVATININGLGLVNLTKFGSLPLEANDITTGRIYEIIYDGLQFQIKDIDPNITVDVTPTFTTVDVTNKVTAPLVEATTNLFTPLIIDSNDNEVLSFTYDTLPVNFIDIKNSNTGEDPLLSAKGDDVDVSLGFSLEGLGSYNFYSTNVSATKLKVFENTTNGNDYIQIKAPESITTSYDLTLPLADGSSGDVLQTDGSGNLSFIPLSSLIGITQYSGATVYPTATKAVGYTDLDLSSEVGVNRAEVTLSVEYTGPILGSVAFREKGQTKDIGDNGIGGISSSTIDTGNLVYIKTITDSNGVVEWAGGGDIASTFNVKLITYTVL